MPDSGETPLDTYVQAAAAPGTVDYYVLLFCEDAWRAAVAAGLALGKVIMNIPRQDTDTDIRYLKLQWWREEAARTRARQPRHPLTVALDENLDHTGWTAALDRLIAGAESDLHVTRFDSLSQLLPHCHYAAERQALLASLEPECNDAAMASARAAGVGICLTELLRDNDTRLPARGFTDGDGDPAMQLTAIAEDHFAAMQSHGATVHATVALQAALYRRMLHRGARGASVHPLTLLWQAWRQARKLRR